MAEFSFRSRKKYADPFSEVEVSAVFIDPEGNERVVPSFWAGGNLWRVRYSSQLVGKHHFATKCSDELNGDPMVKKEHFKSSRIWERIFFSGMVNSESA